MIDENNVIAEVNTMYAELAQTFLDNAKIGLVELLNGRLAFPFGLPDFYRAAWIPAGQVWFILSENKVYLSMADVDRIWERMPIKVRFPVEPPADKSMETLEKWAVDCADAYRQDNPPDVMGEVFKGFTVEFTNTNDIIANIPDDGHWFTIEMK